MDFLFSATHWNFMDLTLLIIGGFIVAIVGAGALALMQNAKDADEAWEEAIKNKQNKDIK